MRRDLWFVAVLGAALGAPAGLGCGGMPAARPPAAMAGNGQGGAGAGGAGGRGGAGGLGGVTGQAGQAGAAGSPVPGAGGSGGARPGATDAATDGPAAEGGTGDGGIDAGPAEPPQGTGDCRAVFGTGPFSPWVEPASDGTLRYRAIEPGGDHIMDFSHAGYRGGGVALPRAPVKVTLMPSGGDDTAQIQAALTMVGTLTPVAGIRGAVLLAPGQFHLDGEGVLRISASGVVLRGSGSGAGGTELVARGTPRRILFLEGAGMRVMEAASAATIVDEHVPAGTRTFTVDRPDAFALGDAVLVGRPVTAPWIALLGMDKLVRNGAMQTWITPGSVLRGERVVTAVAGNKVTVDVPLPDSFEAQYVKPPGGSIVKYAFPGRIAEVGLESFRAVGVPRALATDFHFVRLTAVEDAWISDVVAHDFTSGAVITDTVRRVTIDKLVVSHTPVEYFTAAAPSDFNIDGAQVLIARSGSKGGNKIFYHSTAGGTVGPNVILDFTGSGVRSHLQPHQRWATGLLTDSTSLDDGNIEYINRGTAGSGHGWTMGWGVVWNSSATSIAVFQPPGAANWAIGNRGTQRGDGTFDAHGAAVAPRSLYLAQLCARLGPQALANIGYAR